MTAQLELENADRVAAGHSPLPDVGISGDLVPCACGQSCAAHASHLLRGLLGGKGPRRDEACRGQVTVVSARAKRPLHLCEVHMQGTVEMVKRAAAADRVLAERLEAARGLPPEPDAAADLIAAVSRAIDLVVAGEATPTERALAIVGGIAAEYVVALKRAVLLPSPGPGTKIIRVVSEASDALHACLGVDRDGQTPPTAELERLAEQSRAARKP